MNKSLCLSRSHRLSLSLSLSYRHRFRNIPQEVVVQQFGDANQHGEVDALPLEHLVDNAVVAMDGFRKPPHRATLRLQLRAYHPTDVYVFYVVCRHKKNRELHFIGNRGSRLPYLQIKKAHDCSRAFPLSFGDS